MRAIAVLGTAANESNSKLVAAWQARDIDCALVDPRRTRRGEVFGFEVALGRLDVLPTLDGVEPGLLGVLLLERRGTQVYNTARTLLATHDKLRTAAALTRCGVPHPRTTHLRPTGLSTLPQPPVVLKPRFGSWGRDVRLCQTPREVDEYIDEFATRPWFRRHGVLAQEPIPSRGCDLRLLVAGGRVVGSVERHPQAGEWRTNVSLGARKRSVIPDRQARAIAVSAARAVDADLVGVDLLPLDDTYTVIELNGAVDFDSDYRRDADVYMEIADALQLMPVGDLRAARTHASSDAEEARAVEWV